MAFNKGYELKKFEAHWEKLRIEYAAAGMAEDAIQKMYDYDRQQFNSERTCIERTQELSNSSFECSEDETSPLMQKYMEATTIVDTYHETKSSFAWIGEIEDERLLTALEHLKKEDLEIITLYASYKKNCSHTSTETRCLGGAAGFLHIQTEVSQFGIYFEIPTRRHLLRST